MKDWTRSDIEQMGKDDLPFDKLTELGIGITERQYILEAYMIGFMRAMTTVLAEQRDAMANVIEMIQKEYENMGK